MSLSVEHLRHTADTLEQAILHLQAMENEPPNAVLYDLFRNSAIKSFELSLETAGKLLRKVLKRYVGSPREIDRLVFNDLFRYANKHAVIDENTAERWLVYRANRNTTTHDYGSAFADETLKLLPDYLQDLRQLASIIEDIFNAETTA